MRVRFKVSCLVVSMWLVTSSAVAFGQYMGDPNAQPPPPATSEPAMSGAPPPPMQLAPPMDGPRFRFGIAGALGGEFIDGLSGLMIGADLRLGVQINHLIGIYAQQHLSFGKLSNGSASGITGTYVATAMVDFTFFDHLVAGAGFGYGVLNNPSGPALAFRAAYYPLASISTSSPRRKGLMVGLDIRTVFSSVGTGLVITGGVGYEAF